MNKTLTLAFVMALGMIQAQNYTYSVLTNLLVTNTIAASSTNTFTGTNYLDWTRYRQGDVVIGFTGSGTLSNWVCVSIVPGGDGTNWDYTTPTVFSVQQQGTNRAYRRFELDAPTVGFWKPYQWWSTNAMDVTNLNVEVWVKSVPRN